MSALVQSETKVVTPIPALTEADKVFATAGAVTTGVSIVLAFFSGSPDGWMLPAATGPIMALATSCFASINLQCDTFAGQWITPKKMRVSVFSMLGKKKVYDIQKIDDKGRTINAQYVIGKGSAYIIEDVKHEPLDVWDSSMAAVREVYSLERQSEKIQRKRKDYMETHWGKPEKYFESTDSAEEREFLIASYRASIKKMEQDPNCPPEVLKVKRRHLTELKLNSYTVS